MENVMKLIHALCLSTVFAFLPAVAGNAYADEAAARLALDAAFSDMKTRADKMPDVRFAFTSDYTAKDKKEAVNVVYRFDPSQPEDQQYTILSPAREGHEKLYKKAYKEFKKEQKTVREKGIDRAADRSLLANDLSEMSDSGLVYVRETDDEYIFAFEPGEGGLSFEDDDEPDAEEAEDKPLTEKQKRRLAELKEALKGEMSVDKHSDRINEFHIFSVKSFKPMSGVKVKEIDMRMIFTQLPDGGPYVVESLDAVMRAKLVVIKVSEEESFTNRDFEIK
jgi:hypothetical protein